MSAFLHLPVLSQEAPEALVRSPDGLYVDGTFGRGGHSRLILKRLSPKGRLIAFDRDPQAVAAAAEIRDPRFQIIHAPFSSMKPSLAAIGIDAVDGVFLDIGVSSPQIDDPGRGFSFRFDGPLDMRMDTSAGETAAEWLMHANMDEIARVIADYGEERFARRIARSSRREKLRPLPRRGSSRASLRARCPKTAATARSIRQRGPSRRYAFKSITSSTSSGRRSTPLRRFSLLRGGSPSSASIRLKTGS